MFSDQSKRKCKLECMRQRSSQYHLNLPAILLKVYSKSGREDGKAFPSALSTSSPSALAISEAWLDDRAPDGRVVSGSSRAFTMDWELEQQQWGLLSHQGSVVQISNGNRDAAQSPKCYPCCLGTAICPRNPFILLRSSCRQILFFFTSNPIFRTDHPGCYLQVIRYIH